MNRDILAGKWKEMKGRAKEQWETAFDALRDWLPVVLPGADGAPAALRLLAVAQAAADPSGAARAFLFDVVRDATAAAGMPEGHYHLGPIEVEVKGGQVTADGKLAGSVLTMDHAVRNLARFAGWSLAQSVAAASRNPARVARLAHKGVLATGADADFVVLNSGGEVLRTFVGGLECSA